MDAYNAPLFRSLVNTKRLSSFLDFENADGIFPGVHRSYRFCLLTLCGASRQGEKIDFYYFAHSVNDLKIINRKTSFNAEEIAVFSPNTLAPPMLQNAKDTALARLAYRRFGVLKNYQNPFKSGWSASIQRMLSLSDPGDLFRLERELGNKIENGDWTRLYCGKAIHQYDHRYATWQNSDWVTFGFLRHADPSEVVRTEYYVKSAEVQDRLADKSTSGWLLSYRDVCRATDERTVIAAVVPPVGCDTTCRNIYLSASAVEYSFFLANINSLPFDFFTRQKVIGIHLGAGVFEQLPILPRAIYAESCYWHVESSTIGEWLLPRVLELTYTAWDIETFARDCGWLGPPFRWDEERRFICRCELDASFFHLYFPTTPDGQWKPAPVTEGNVQHETLEQLTELKRQFPIPRDAVSYILDTFPIVRRKDVEKHGEFRTRHELLKIYDVMQESIRTGNPYQTRLNPSPGPPEFEMPEWRPGHPRPVVWPSQLHPPKGCGIE